MICCFAHKSSWHWHVRRYLFLRWICYMYPPNENQGRAWGMGVVCVKVETRLRASGCPCEWGGFWHRSRWSACRWYCWSRRRYCHENAEGQIIPKTLARVMEKHFMCPQLRMVNRLVQTLSEQADKPDQVLTYYNPNAIAMRVVPFCPQKIKFKGGWEVQAMSWLVLSHGNKKGMGVFCVKPWRLP